MNYIGINCPACGKTFEQTDDVVVCPICGTPHHRNCWEENNRCINEEKHIEGFIWQMHNSDTPDANNAQSKNMKVCPRCGEHNAQYEPVCIRCGERLKSEQKPVINQFPPFGNTPFGNWQTQTDPEKFSPYQNVYAVDAKNVYGNDTKIDDIPVSEIAEFVQKDSTKYIGKFLDMQTKNSKISWNWSAGLASVFWCFYRKMVGLGVAFMAIFFSVYLISSLIPVTVYQNLKPEVYAEYAETVTQLNNELTEILQNGATSVTDTSEYYALVAELLTSPINITAYIIQIAAVLIMSIIMGFLGNHFYKKKIIKDINSIRRVSGDSMTYHFYLRQRGNVSVVNLLLPVLCYMFFSTMTTYF